MLQKGLKVIIDPASESYSKYQYQHMGNIGIVLEESGGGSMYSRVQWSHGHTNTYKDSVLIVLEDKLTPEEIEANKQYELPLFPGTRVCPNPESDNFEYLSKLGEKGAANVVMLANNISNLKRWGYIKNKAAVSILIKFDNGKVASCLHRDVLRVDTKPRNVIRFIYEDETTDTCFTDETEILNRIYSRIIKNEEILKSKIEYDDEWRAKETQQIINNSIDVK